MAWSLGFDEHWKRDIGYGVPAVCDHPKCDTKIHRGLSYVCGNEAFGGEKGCGLFFCYSHLMIPNQLCPRCTDSKSPYKHPKPDTEEWLRHKLTDESWSKWRNLWPDDVKKLKEQLEKINAETI